MADPVQTLLLFETLFLLGCLIVMGRLLVNRTHPSSPDKLKIPLSETSTSDSMTPLKTEIQALRQEGLRLREELTAQQQVATIEVQRQTFQTLQTLLTNYPSLRPMIQAKPDLPARNLVALLTPLDNLLEQWGIVPIGSAWEQVAFDPQLHQADQGDIQLGELVYIRFVGYRFGDTILCPAKVSRTLPGGGT